MCVHDDSCTAVHGDSVSCVYGSVCTCALIPPALTHFTPHHRHRDVPPLAGWNDFHLLLCLFCHPTEGGSETRCSLVPEEP